MSALRGKPNVKLVRGPFLRLEPHPDHCETEDEFVALCARLRERAPGAVLAADLFAGAGGMSLGLQQAGMHVVLGADHDTEALETHRHHFPGMALDWDLGDPKVVARVAQLMRAGGVDVLAGGPPCQPFSKAGRSLMRYLVREGSRESDDHRRHLWRSYLEVVRLARPRAVIMENVPDMALDREMFILRSMVFELERLGYSVQERVVDTWRYGVPQFRQRLILVAAREGAGFQWPRESDKVESVESAISDLPAVKGGWRPEGGADGWAHYPGPKSEFQRLMRSSVAASDSDKVFDHITRPVREDDEAAFQLLDSESRYSDLPDELKRYRDDIFDDKYKRLDAHQLSRTITAHIAKDGYWYIHPEQNRTITVREAARLQTFPDHFRFAGSPTAAFRQIGNAVPPLLGLAIGRATSEALQSKGTPPATTEFVSALLADWFANVEEPRVPWLKSANRWQVLSAEGLLERASDVAKRAIWPLLMRYQSPGMFAAAKKEVLEIASWIDATDQADILLEVAEMASNDETDSLTDHLLDELVASKHVRQAAADLAMLVSSEGEEPVVVTTGAVRVAARVNVGLIERQNRHTQGRIAIARLVGFGARSREAHLGLLELAATICRPTAPLCAECPLNAHCDSAFR
jgi:DNA (cytosine-5)-methyltransferase 1